MSLLTDFRLSVLEKNLGVYGINVFQRGKEIDSYKFRCDDRVNLFSGSKTFTSMGVGIAEYEKLFSLEDKVLDFFKEYKDIAVNGSEDITIENLLNMSSGHMSSGFSTNETTHEQKIDWAKLFFEEPMREKAGSKFFYENSCTYMLGRIIEIVSGDNLRDYLIPRLFKPLYIPFPNWNTCPKGHILSASGLHLNTEEFSRLGILMLNKGIFNCKQVVPETYIKKSITNTVDSSSWNDPECSLGYGYQIWKCSFDNSFRADGKYGQFSIVIPSYDAVITITSHNENNANDILRTVWSQIMPHL